MSRKRTKILSVAAVLLMLGTLLTAVAFVSGANGNENGNLTISVQDTDVNPVTGYYIELYDVLSGKKYVYDGLSFTTTLKDISPGYYELVFPSQEIGNTVYFRDNRTVEIYPSETAHVSLTVSYVSENISLKGFAKSDTNEDLANATVTIKDTDSDFSKEVLTNSTGYYETNIYAGNFLVEIEYKGYVVNYTYITINSDSWVNGTLTNKPYVWGSVLDENGEVVSGEVREIMFDKNTGEIITHVSETGAYMVPIYSGNFSMFINAEGYDTYYIPSVDCDGNSVHMPTISLAKSVGSSMSYALSFNGDDFNSLHVVNNWKISPSETINALPGNELGNIRLQVDYFFGNMDGAVNSTEANEFSYWLDSHTAMTSTADLISVNGTYYKLNESTISVSVSGLEGSVNSSAPVFINTSFDMNSYSSIAKGKDVPFKLTVKYDDSTDYSYSITLPSGYERTHTHSPSDVSVDNFTSIQIDPQTGSGTATVSFVAEKSMAGNASIEVSVGEFVYKKGNTTYIVRDKKNVEFHAIFTDPNGNEKYANYTWDFGDGTVKYGKKVTHNYSDGGKYEVSLTVKEAGGNISTANLTVLVDNTHPTPVIDSDKLSNGMIVADENEAIEFDASNSTDIIYGNVKGSIASYYWDFGDNSTSTRKVADHSYAKWGYYTVTLKVTDVVGNYYNKTIQVHIKDITPPVPRFNWTDITKNKTGSYKEGAATIYEGDTVKFDASPSYDPSGFKENGSIESYSWQIKKGDKELYNSTEKTFMYTFQSAGDYTITLNVTDMSGNYKSVSKLFTVKYGPRPKLVVENVTLSTDTPAEGDTIYIIANVSNNGDAAANSPSITFYVNGEPVNGEPKFYKYVNGSLVETNATIPAHEYRIVKMAWTPAQGTYTIKVNATDPNEPPSIAGMGESNPLKVVVGPAAWKGMIPIIVLIVVIAAIIGVYYAYSRGMGPFGEGEKKKEKKK